MRVGPGGQETAGNRSEWTAGSVGPSLRGQVIGYAAFRGRVAVPVEHLETPSGEVVLILTRDGGFTAETRAGSGELAAFESLVAGPGDRPLRTRFHGNHCGVQVRLTPPAAYRLFGVPLHELANRTVTLSDLVGPAAGRWADLALDGGFERLDRMLSARLCAGPAPAPEVERALQLMRRGDGSARIGDLPGMVGCGPRRLVALFREQVGTTPKAAAQVLRYARAARLLTGGSSPSATAAICGYADQAHLTREVRRYASATPGQLSPARLY